MANKYIITVEMTEAAAVRLRAFVIASRGAIILEDFTRPDDVWASDSDYEREQWQSEVFNGNTSLGYWEWVDHQKQSEAG